MSDDPLFDGDDDANTPLAPEERDGLIPSYITLRRELNEAEQVNIDQGDRWAFNPRARHDVLSEDFIKALHMLRSSVPSDRIKCARLALIVSKPSIATPSWVEGFGPS